MALFDSKGRSSAQLLDAELSGLDALELPIPRPPHPLRRLWSAAWPKLLAAAIGLGIWQLVAMSGWRPNDELPGPRLVFATLFENFSEIMGSVGVTLARGAIGYPIAVAFGTAIGIAVARTPVLRAAVGSLIAGLLTVPSVAWFPVAVLLFGPTQNAVLFVIVIGASPAAANGLITGVDHTPPILIRTGKVLGANRWEMLRHVVLPAALPSYVAGLKNAWAFAWRALIAGELLVKIAGKVSLGERLSQARESEIVAEVFAITIVILAVGTIIDALIFANLERRIRRRYGLVDAADEA